MSEKYQFIEQVYSDYPVIESGQVYPAINLRDMFAAKAMPIVAEEEPSIGAAARAIGLDSHDDWISDIHWPQYVAHKAYLLADAMLKAREEKIK